MPPSRLLLWALAGILSWLPILLGLWWFFG